MKSNTGYIGRYTVAEYALGKHHMLKEHPELRMSQIDAVCRYVATKDWPKDRRDTYIFAKNTNDLTAEFLRMYDECQWIYDAIHHGPGFIRFFEEINGVPEATHEFSRSLVAEAITAGTYTGKIPSQFLDLLPEE